MGHQKVVQDQLFHSFHLEDHIPRNHLLRAIDRVLDLGELRRHLADYYSHTGRPSIGPELMIRMLIIGYCYGIRSERRLCEEVHLNLAYRWFCRLGLEDPVPEHSTFSRNRHGRFRESDVFRGCLMRWFAVAWRRIQFRAKGSRWTPVLSRPMRTADRACRGTDRSNGMDRRGGIPVRCESISTLWMERLRWRQHPNAFL